MRKSYTCILHLVLLSVVVASTNVPKSSGGNRLRDLLLNRGTNDDTDSALAEVQPPEIDSLLLRPRIISLNIMVAGLSGLGKTTMCTALLESLIENENENNYRGTSAKKPQKSRRTVLIDESRQFEKYDERANTILKVRIVDTPGFGNRINHKNSVQPIRNYIESCRQLKFQTEMTTSSVKDYIQSTEDKLVHVCLYFISPGRLLEIDLHFLKQVQHEVTIVPIIAKADTLTNDEITWYRQELKEIFERERISVYNFDDSTTSGKKNKFNRGRRPSEALAIISRDGMYPWGKSNSFDPNHSDLQMIRDLLLSEHTERFLESAIFKYSKYRSKRIAHGKFNNALKYIALISLVTLQLTGTSYLNALNAASASASSRRRGTEQVDALLNSVGNAFSQLITIVLGTGQSKKRTTLKTEEEEEKKEAVETKDLNTEPTSSSSTSSAGRRLFGTPPYESISFPN